MINFLEMNSVEIKKSIGVFMGFFFNINFI